MKRFASFWLDTANECLWQNGVQITLPPKPFAVLRYLVENPGRLITHNELLDALWPETYVQPQVLRTYMLDLRKILGDDRDQPRFIQTLPKRGYCFVASTVDRTGMEHRAVPATASPASKPFEIVGREEELARLRTLVESLATGQRQVVFVTGEAGIGKTALLDAFCRQAGSWLPVKVAHGQCIEGLGVKEEYYPLMVALGQLCSEPDGEKACRILARMAPAWLAILRRDPTEGATAHERTLGDICAAVEELAAETPLILLFEDLQWADLPTLQLISTLARRRAQARLMILATCTPQDTATDHPLRVLKQDLRMRRLCQEIALTPMSRAAVGELLCRELKQEVLPPGLAGFVHRQSEGNPLFAIAILEHLIGQRLLMREGTADAPLWKLAGLSLELEAGVPDGLAKMIELEVERLSPHEQCLLEAGSLMNFAFPAWAVAAALQMDLAEVEEACDRLARRLHFLERAGQDELPDGTHSAFYVFAHGLYREVLYNRQGTARRSSRHLRIAERLGVLFAGRKSAVAREMAMHYEAAHDWQRAVRALRAAAQQAVERKAHAEAGELLDRALRLAENLQENERATTIGQIQSQLAIAGDAIVPGQSPGGESPEKLDDFWTGT